MIVLDYQDRRPLYEQVEEKFRNLILMGVLEVRKLSKASYIKELKTLIRKGKAMGMEAEELIYIIRECYKEEKP